MLADRYGYFPCQWYLLVNTGKHRKIELITLELKQNTLNTDIAKEGIKKHIKNYTMVFLCNLDLKFAKIKCLCWGKLWKDKQLVEILCLSALSGILHSAEFWYYFITILKH